MTEYPKDDWRNVVPKSDIYDRDALIAFREALETHEQTSEDMAFVMSMSDAEVNAYCKLCEAWTKQFGEQEKLESLPKVESLPEVESPPEVESLPEEPKNLKERIQHRLDRLETYMKDNNRIQAKLLEPEISKFWSVLSEADKDFIQGVRIALEDDLDWNTK